MTRPLAAWVIVAGFFVLGAAQPTLHVTVHEDRLSVLAEKASLYDVLLAISKQTGLAVGIPETGEAAGPTVTVEFKDLPIEEGIARLLRTSLMQSSYIIVFDAHGRLAAVQIVGGASSSSPSPPTRVTAPDTSRAMSPETTNVPGRHETIEASSDPDDDPLEQALEKARAAKDPEARIQALRALGAFQDPRTLALLQPALQSEIPEVRRAALEAMRDGTVYEAAALSDVRSVAVADTEPAVRQAALEVLVRYDESGDARAILKTLAADKNSTFRSFAQRNLDRMEEEARYRAGPDTQLLKAQGLLP